MRKATCRECDLLTSLNGPEDSDGVQLVRRCLSPANEIAAQHTWLLHPCTPRVATPRTLGPHTEQRYRAAMHDPRGSRHKTLDGSAGRCLADSR
jgi:hypothetical protein